MDTMEFLRRVFPLSGDDGRAGDLVRFILVSQKDPWPGTWHWMTRAEIHAVDGAGIGALPFPTSGCDVYVTPHGFTKRSRHVTKDEAVGLCDTCWVELDDEINPQAFTPPPSLAVQTSKGRYHLYWFLAAPLPSSVVEQINYRLAYGNGLKKDTSGWALTKLLRLPGSVSYKRTDPFVVEVAADGVHPERQYREADFEQLPLAPNIVSIHAVPPPPVEGELPSPEEVRARYAVSKRLDDLLTRKHPNRSQALWETYHLCFEAGMTPEETYALVRNTPNDKFTGWRYNGEMGLWRDIRKGYSVAQKPEDQPIIAKLDAIAYNKGVPPEIKRREIANLIWQDLNNRGRVFFDETRRDAYYYDGERVIPMDPKDRRWRAFMSIQYSVTDGNPGYVAINAALYALATQQAQRITPHSLCYWDRDQKLLYLYNGGGVVYRLNGDVFDAVENGTDGVMFRENDYGDPFVAEAPVDGEVHTSLDDAIFHLPNFVNDTESHFEAQARQLFRIWAMSLFFGEQLDARPHLVVVGPTSSGKSLGLQALAELIYGEGATVSTIPRDSGTFETAASNAPFVFFDNVDTEHTWLLDKLAEVATGIQFSRRVLYTTNENVVYRVKTFLALTTRDEWFARADIATRLIVLRVQRRETQTSPTMLLDVIRRNRSELWFELLGDLNAVIRQLKTQKVKAHTIRMAGYADFVEACCRAMGYNARELISVVSGAQQASALTHSVIWEVLKTWLHRVDRLDPTVFPNDGQLVATTRLHQELRAVASGLGCQRDYDRKVGSARSLSHQLRELLPDLQSLVEVEFDNRSGTNRYRFTLKSRPKPEVIESQAA